MRSKYYSYFLVDVLLTPLFPTSVTRCLSVTHWCFVIPIIFSSYRIVSSVYYSNESNILFSWSLSQSAVSRLSLYILEKSARVFPHSQNRNKGRHHSFVFYFFRSKIIVQKTLSVRFDTTRAKHDNTFYSESNLNASISIYLFITDDIDTSLLFDSISKNLNNPSKT